MIQLVLKLVGLHTILLLTANSSGSNYSSSNKGFTTHTLSDSGRNFAARFDKHMQYRHHGLLDSTRMVVVPRAKAHKLFSLALPAASKVTSPTHKEGLHKQQLVANRGRLFLGQKRIFLDSSSLM